jgi:hypothetical protein
MNVTHSQPGGDLNAVLADLCARGFSVAIEQAAGGQVFADLYGPAGTLAGTAIGATPAEAIGAVWPPDADGQDDTPDPRCATCGARVGEFGGRPGWQHWRVIRRVVETFDAGHAAQLADAPPSCGLPVWGDDNRPCGLAASHGPVPTCPGGNR